MKGTLKGHTLRRCGCKDPKTGKQYGSRCPDLTKRHHGTYGFSTRIDLTGKDEFRLKRFGYETKTDAQNALNHVAELLKLAAGDDRIRRKIGDLIVERSKQLRRGGTLPDVDEVKRRIGVGEDLAAPGLTVAEWLEEWLAGKRKLKKSVRNLYRGHVDHYFVPLIGQIPLRALNVEHIANIFDRIDEWNEEITSAKAEKRKPHLPDDVRKQSRRVHNSSQNRILQTLRNALNVALVQRKTDWNPCLAVELPPEVHDPAKVWSPEQVAVFLAESADHPLGLVYRIILLCGLRRGEAIGIRLSDVHDDGLGVNITQTVLEVNGEVVLDTPKTASGKRQARLDPDTAKLIPAERIRRNREKLAAGEAYTDHGLLFAQEDGTPLRPGSVSYYFRKLAAEAGLPIIRLHDGRHTAATLALEAGLDIKVVSERLGHSTTRITQDLYTHVRQAVHDDAAEKVVALLPPVVKKRKDTGS